MRVRYLLLAAAVLVPSFVMADDESNESSAIEKIELLGGKVRRNAKLPGRPVNQIIFKNPEKFGDEYIHLFGSFPHLSILVLHEANITNAGVKALREITNDYPLRELDLSGCTQVSDDALREIAGLKQLTSLMLSGTQVTDVGLKELAGLKRLRRLWLSSTQVTGTGLKELRDLKDLTHLFLDRTKVSDIGAREVGALTNLKLVDLMNTQISDVGLTELRHLKNLTYLDLTNTRITEAASTEFKAFLPNVRILR